MPLHCAGDDGVYGRVFRLPAEDNARVGRIGIKGGWISFAARTHGMGNFFTGSPLNCVENFFHRGGLAGAEIKENLCAWFIEMVKGSDVSRRKVIDVDVIAEASTVGRRIVVAKNLEGWGATEGSGDGEGNEMRLGRMIFAD